MTLNQCTLSGNSASGTFDHNGGGGGIENFEADDESMHRVGNKRPLRCSLGGGIYNNVTLAMTTTIVAENISMYGADIYSGSLTYGGSNLPSRLSSTAAIPVPLPNQHSRPRPARY